MKYRAKKLIAFLMALLMVGQMMPTSVFAEQLEFKHTVQVNIESGVVFPENQSLYVAVLQKQTAEVPTDSGLSWMNGQEYWFYDIQRVTSSTSELLITDLHHFDQELSQAYQPAGTNGTTKVFFGICDGNAYNFQNGQAGNNFIDCSTSLNGNPVTMVTSGNKTTITIRSSQEQQEPEEEADITVSVSLPDGFAAATKDFEYRYFIVAGTVNAGFASVELKNASSTQGFSVPNPAAFDPNASLVLLKKFRKDNYETGDENSTTKGEIVVSNWNNVYNLDFEDEKYHAQLSTTNGFGLTITRNEEEPEELVAEANSSNLGVKIHIDKAGLDVSAGDNYYFVMKVDHRGQYDSNTHYVVMPLSISESASGDLIIKDNGFAHGNNGSIWLDMNGAPQNVDMSNQTITGINGILLTHKNGGASNFSELIQQGYRQNPYKDFIYYNNGSDFNGYKVQINNTVGVIEINDLGEATCVGPTITFTKGNGISKPSIDAYLKTAVGFGLYTRELAQHDTDMESNIAAHVVTGFGGADYGFSNNNIYVNNIKFVKKYADKDGNPLEREVTLKLYEVEMEGDNPKRDANGKIVAHEVNFSFTSPGDNTDGSSTNGTTVHVGSTISGTTVNGILQGTFTQLPNGTYMIKEVVDGQEYSFEDGTNKTIVIGEDENKKTIKFVDGLITIDNPYTNRNYFGSIAHGVDLNNIVTHSRQGTIYVEDKPSYDRLAAANGGTNGQIGNEETNTSTSNSTIVHAKGKDVLNIPKDLNNLKTLSAELYSAQSSDTVQVITIKSSDIKEGINIRETAGRYVVVNVIVDTQGSLKLTTSYNGRTLNPDFGHGGREDSAKVLYNILDTNGNPYTGTVTTQGVGSGILLCPAGTVGELGANWGGTIICDIARHSGSEIHSDNVNRIISKNTMITNTEGDTSTGELIIEKQFAETVDDRDTWFTFEITLTNENNEPISGTFVANGLKNGKTKITFNSQGKATATVRANNRLIISGLPNGAKYSITEVPTSSTTNYTFKKFEIINGTNQTINGNLAEGNINKDKTPTIVAINETEKAGLKLTKYVDGTENIDREFKFDLYLWKVNKEGHAVKYEKRDVTYTYSYERTDKTGTINFDHHSGDTYDGHEVSVASKEIVLHNGEEIILEGLEKGVHFAFKEKTPLPEGYSLGGDLTGVITGTVDDKLYTFENKYNATGEGEIKVQKTLNGRPWNTNDSFEFTITPVNNAPSTEESTVIVTKDSTDYTESFGKVTFTKAGTYTWTITETHKGEKINGITYDNTNKTITITVVDDGHGHLVADTDSALVKTAEFENRRKAARY